MNHLPYLRVLLAALFLSGCTSGPDRPETGQISPPLTPTPTASTQPPLVPAHSFESPPRAPRFLIDSKSSEIILLVRTSGRLAGRIADDHIIRASWIQGEMQLLQSLAGSSYRLQIPVEGFQVDHYDLRKHLGYRGRTLRAGGTDTGDDAGTPGTGC